MLYNITINQQKAVELNLTANEAFVLHGILTLCGRNGIEHHDTNGTRYYWLSKNLLCQQLPLLQLKADSMYRIVKTLRDKGFIEMLESKHIQEFYRTTPLADSLLMTVGNFSEHSDRNSPKIGQNTLKVGKKSVVGSENFPTIIDKNNNIESAPNFSNLPLCVESENNFKKSSKVFNKKHIFALDSYQPSNDVSNEVWEQVVKPAIEYRLQLQNEQATATDRKKYNVTERVVHGYENIATKLVSTHGLKEVANYIKRAIADGITWVALLSSDDYVKSKINAYAKEMKQDTDKEKIQVQPIVTTNIVECAEKSRVPAFSKEAANTLYERFQDVCKQLPHATPLTAEQFSNYFLGAMAEKGCYLFVDYASYTKRIKQAIAAKAAQTKGFYKGSILDIIQELIKSRLD